MITIKDERIFNISNDNVFQNTTLKESDILIHVKEILKERKQMPRKMELKFVYFDKQKNETTIKNFVYE